MSEFLDYSEDELRIMLNEKHSLFREQNLDWLTALYLDWLLARDDFLNLPRVQVFFHFYQQLLVKVVEDVQQNKYETTELERKDLLSELSDIFSKMEEHADTENEEIIYPIKINRVSGRTDIEFDWTAIELSKFIEKLFWEDLMKLIWFYVGNIIDLLNIWKYKDDHTRFQMSFTLSSEWYLWIEIDEPYPPELEDWTERDPYWLDMIVCDEIEDILDTLQQIWYSKDKFSLQECIVIERWGWGKDDNTELEPVLD